MKKLLLLLIVPFMMVACEGPMGPMGPQGPTGAPGQGPGWLVFDLEIEPYEWVNKGNFYSYAENVPALTHEIYNDGIINAYIEMDGGDGKKYQQPLPYIRFFIDNNVQVSEMFDFDITAGRITVYNTFSDFYMPGPPDFTVIRVVCIW